MSLPTEFCPVMYSYITTDTSSFLSDPNHVEVVIALYKQVCVHVTAILLLPMATVHADFLCLLLVCVCVTVCTCTYMSVCSSTCRYVHGCVGPWEAGG